MFRKFLFTASVSRQTQSTDWGFKKTSFSPTGKSYAWHLKALRPDASVGISSFGTDFSFRTSPLADIKESDRLTIDSQAYEVKGVQNHKGVTFAMLDCYLVKVEDAG